MTIMTLIIAIMILITTVSCTSNVKYQPVELVLPPPIPEEARLTNEELTCLSDTTYQKIVILDKRRKTLRAIIESTKNK